MNNFDLIWFEDQVRSHICIIRKNITGKMEALWKTRIDRQRERTCKIRVQPSTIHKWRTIELWTLEVCNFYPLKIYSYPALSWFLYILKKRPKYVSVLKRASESQNKLCKEKQKVLEGGNFGFSLFSNLLFSEHLVLTYLVLLLSAIACMWWHILFKENFISFKKHPKF